MTITAAYLGYTSHGEAVPLRNDFAGFPKQLGQWHGVSGSFDQQAYDVLGVDDSLLMVYHGPGNRQIQLYVGYYQSQRKGDLIHSPRHCMPGSGWNITQSEVVRIQIPSRDNETIKAVRLIIEQRQRKQVVLYWFQSRGRFIASEYMQKIYLVWDAVFKNRTDGAFVRLMAPVGGKEETGTEEMLKSFAGDLVPFLTDYLPGAQAQPSTNVDCER